MCDELPNMNTMPACPWSGRCGELWAPVASPLSIKRDLGRLDDDSRVGLVRIEGRTFSDNQFARVGRMDADHAPEPKHRTIENSDCWNSELNTFTTHLVVRRAVGA